MMLTGSLLAAANPLDHVLDVPQIWSSGEHGIWWLTNHMIMLCLAAVLMLIFFPLVTRRYRGGDEVPTGTRNLVEAIMMYIRNDVAKPVMGDEADRFMPFLWTLFFFILFNNLLGLLPLEPITGPIMRALFGEHAHGIYGTATSNIYVTGALGLVSFIVIQVSGIRANGVGKYLKHFLAGAPWYMMPIMVPVEMLGMIVKPVALAIRLMANMTAGHILLAVLAGFTAAAATLGYGALTGIGLAVVLGSVAIMVLELFVALLHAYIFTFLTALFIGQLVVHEHEEHSGEGGEHHEKEEVIGGGDMLDMARLPDKARQTATHVAG